MPHIPVAVCGMCNREMRPLQNDVTLMSQTSFGPYYKVKSDLWECKTCGTTILIGFPRKVLAEAFESGFENIPFDRIFDFSDADINIEKLRRISEVLSKRAERVALLYEQEMIKQSVVEETDS